MSVDVYKILFWRDHIPIIGPFLEATIGQDDEAVSWWKSRELSNPTLDISEIFLYQNNITELNKLPCTWKRVSKSKKKLRMDSSVQEGDVDAVGGKEKTGLAWRSQTTIL